MKSLSALLKGITSNHDGKFYCKKKQQKKFKKHERLCDDHDYCHVEMPDEDNKILKYNYVDKSLKDPFMVYADFDCLLEKMHSCQSNPEKSFAEKKNKHTPSG